MEKNRLKEKKRAKGQMKPNGKRDRVEWKPKGSVKRELSEIVTAGNANTVKSQALFL